MGRYKEPYTIYKRGDYWYYRTYDINGLRTSGKSTGKKLKSEARLYCEDLYKKGKLIHSTKKFGLFAAGFFEPNSLYFADRLKPPARNTLLIYRNCLNKYIIPFFNNYELGDINYLVLKKFRMSLINSGKSYNTIQTIFMTLNIVLNYAYRAGDIEFNPIKRLEPLAKQKENIKKDSFTLEEIKTIYNTISPIYKNFILILALTGLRISEAAGVSESDIKKDSNNNYYIDLKKQYGRGEFLPLKNKLARPVPISEELKNIIVNSEIMSDKNKIYFYLEFKKIRNNIKDYEARKLTPHSLRHFFITKGKAAGINESKIEFVAGHSLKGMSAIYTNYKPDDLAEVITWQKETFNKITL